jgi:crossover junction endodeoxyribonuclease RuvC
MSIGVGIDPSFSGTGAVLVGKSGILKMRLFKLKKFGDRPIDELSRICTISDTVCQWVSDEVGKEEDAIVAIEGLAMMSRNTTSLVQLAALNYFIRRDVIKNGLTRFVTVAPSSLKKFIAGKGNVKKDVLLMETYRRWGEVFTDDNLCDANGLAKIAYAVATGDTEELAVPQKEVINLVTSQL